MNKNNPLSSIGKHEIKTLGEAIGMPDEKDKEIIANLIKIHEKMTGGLLAYTVNESRKEFEAGKYGSVFNDDARVNKESNTTYDFEFPASFVQMIEKYYPTMFRDVAHYRWLKKNLVNLMVRPNTKRGAKK